MPGTSDRPGDRHKRDPIGYRPPADVWPFLDAYKEATGLGASAVISRALREFFAKPASAPEAGESPVA